MGKAGKIALIVFLLLLILAIGINNGKAEGQKQMWMFCHPSDGVHIREKPNSKSKNMGIVCYGDSVVVSGVTKKDSSGEIWYQLASDILGQDEFGGCWVWGPYLMDSPIIENRYQARIFADGRVAARKYPDSSSKRAQWLKVGQHVKVYAECGEWSYTNKGYVKTEYLRPLPKSEWD